MHINENSYGYFLSKFTIFNMLQMRGKEKKRKEKYILYRLLIILSPKLLKIIPCKDIAEI